MDQKAPSPPKPVGTKTNTLAFHTNKPKLVIDVESRQGSLNFLEAKIVLAYTPNPEHPHTRPFKIRDVQALPQGEIVDEKVWEVRPGPDPISVLKNVHFVELVFKGLDFTQRVGRLECEQSSPVTELYRAILSQAELRFVVQIGDSEVGVFDISLANRIIDISESTPSC